MSTTTVRSSLRSQSQRYTSSVTLPPVLKPLSIAFSTFVDAMQSQGPKKIFDMPSKLFSRLPARYKKYNLKKIVPIALLVLIVAVVLVRLTQAASTTAAPAAGDTRYEVKGAVSTKELNREFQYPIKDSKGKEVTKLKYLIENAELRDEIIVKGQRAVAVKGRLFLILTIKVTNDYNKGIDLNARDYIRLATANNPEEKLAPDVHNDPVTVQAISTKYTRLGFPINDTDRKMTLYVGELNGDKEAIELEL